MSSYTLLQKVRVEFDNLKKEVFASYIKDAHRIDAATVQANKAIMVNPPSAFIEEDSTGRLFTIDGKACNQQDFDSAPFEIVG